MASDQGKGPGQIKTIRRRLEGTDVKPTAERPPARKQEKPEAAPPPVPRGRRDGDIRPTSDPTNPVSPTKPPKEEDPVVFETDTPVGGFTTDGNLVVDACGGCNEGAVMMCGNRWALYSNNAGANFVDVPLGSAFDMTATVPGVRGEPAGDQVIHYVPAIDRFIWLLLYYPEAGGLNSFSIAVAKPSDLAASGGQTGWHRWDFTSTFLGLGSNFIDFPDLAVTGDHLYISACSAMGTTTNGFVVSRVPLNQLASGGTIDVFSTDLADSNGMSHGRLVQNSNGQAVWATHVDANTLRVFNWPTGAAEPSVRDIDVQQWPWEIDAQGNKLDVFRSMTPPIPANDPAKRVPVNWLGGAFSSIMAGVQRRNEVILGWTAGRGGAFPHPHVRLVTLDTGTWTVAKEAQIWHPDHAWAYPWLALNAPEEVGIALGWGGGGIHFGSTAFGIPEDHVLWYSEPSDTASDRWGDYVTVRQSIRNRSLFGGFGYTLRYDAAGDVTRANPRYTHFGRQSVA